MEYNVRIIDDDELPKEVPWAFVRKPGALCFWLKESVAGDPAALTRALEESWEAFRLIKKGDVFSWPPPVMSAQAAELQTHG